MKAVVAMTASRPLRSSLAPLAAFAAGAVVTAALADVRRRSAPEVRTTEPAADVRPVEDAPPPLETRARAPAGPVIAALALSPPNPLTAAPALPPPNPLTAATTLPPPNPLAVDAKQPDTGALAEELQELRDRVARLQQELGQARADSQTAVLLDVDRHVASIGAQLAENQARHEQESEVAQRAAAQRDHAVQMLFEPQVVDDRSATFATS